MRQTNYCKGGLKNICWGPDHLKGGTEKYPIKCMILTKKLG